MDASAIIFVPALAGTAIMGFVLLLYTAHYYITILESTAAGAREIPWGSEPITDNFGQLWYMLWLVGLWVGPASLIGRMATAGIESGWVQLAIPLVVFWLFYPLSQLSSLSASTVWLPLTPDVFSRLAQKPGIVLGFFALSSIVLILMAVGLKWAFLTPGNWHLLFVGAPLVVVAGLVYARLIGRLAFALRFTKGLFDRKETRPKADPPPVRPRTVQEHPTPVLVQPDELPPLNSPEGEVSGYNILIQEEETPRPRTRLRAEAVEPLDSESEAPPEPRPRRPATPSNPLDRSRVWTDEDDEPTTAYGVNEPEVTPAEAKPQTVIKPSAAEEQLHRREDRPKKPRRVWEPALLAFLGQPGTVLAIGISSGLCLVVGMFVRIMREFNPAGSAGAG